MKKRLQTWVSAEAWTSVESLLKEANEGFDVGKVTLSDLMNDIISSSKVDIKGLQHKHTDLRRSLKVMASKADLDIESVIKSLSELKAKSAKRPSKNTNSDEEVS